MAEKPESTHPPDTEEEYATKTADELTAFAKKATEAEDWKNAVGRFSAALQKKIKDHGNEELHPSLGVFYLNYGDSVLNYEENSTSLLHGEDEADDDGDDDEIVEKNADPTATNKGEEEEASLLQIAYENLSIAALILTTKVKAGAMSGTKTSPASEEDVMRCSLAYIRLGDLALLEKKFEDSAKNYEEAVNMRKSNKIHYTKIYNTTFHIAHALEYQLKFEEALVYYQDAVSSLERHIKGEDCKEPIPGNKLGDYEENLKTWKSTLEVCKQELEVKKNAEEEEAKNPTIVKPAGGEAVDMTSMVRSKKRPADGEAAASDKKKTVAQKAA